MTRTKNVFEFADTGTNIQQTVQESGFVRALVVNTPNFTNNVTSTITIKDSDSYILYVSNALIKNDEIRIANQEIPLDYNYTIDVDISEAAGGSGGDVSVMLYIKNTVRG